MKTLCRTRVIGWNAFRAAASAVAVAACAALLPTPGLPAQEKPRLPAFEAASIRPAANSALQTAAELERSLSGTTTRIELRPVTLANLIIRAFSLRQSQFSGPDWLKSAAFDISAVAPAGSSKEQVLLMYQNLLAERFHLRYHRESAEAPVYALTVRPGAPKLPPGIPDSDPANLGQIGQTAQSATPSGPVTATARAAFGIYTLSSKDGVVHYEFQNISMEDLAQFLNPTGSGPLDRLVVDKTELPGRYQVSLDIPISEMHGQRAAPPAAAGDAPTASDPPNATIRSTLEKQGLQLVRRTATAQKFVVDGIERTPSEN